MEYSPPPLFKQGASARAKMIFFALIALTLLVADSRLRTLITIRQGVGTVLYPLQMAALMPRDAAYRVSDYFTSLARLEDENKNLKLKTAANAQILQQARQLVTENVQLRKLLGTTEQIPVESLMSEILYDARDPFTRKIILNRGTRHGVSAGQPVIDDVGVVGQVTRVFLFTSEVTLLTDKDQAIPVQVVRSGLRSVAYGRGQSGTLDLRFMAANADIKKGDELVTSGIDGVYPPGLSVAKVVKVENKSTDAFAHIACQPTAGIDRNRHLLILLADTNIAARPDEEQILKRDRLGRKRNPDAIGDAAKELSKDMAKEGSATTAKNIAADGVRPIGGTPASIAVKDPSANVAKPVDKDGDKAVVSPAKAGVAIVNPGNQDSVKTVATPAAKVTVKPATETTAPASPAKNTVPAAIKLPENKPAIVDPAAAKPEANKTPPSKVPSP